MEIMPYVGLEKPAIIIEYKARNLSMSIVNLNDGWFQRVFEEATEAAQA